MRSLNSLAVQMHLAALHGGGSERSRFIEARIPKPNIEPQCLARTIDLLAISHISAMSSHADEYNRVLSPIARRLALDNAFYARIESDLESVRSQGLYKTERVLSSPQQALIRTDDREVVNLCANNYLGLANHPAVREAAHRAIDRYGYGMASVRFICGTQTIHKQLEESLSRFLGAEDTILYSSCWDANGGLFETVLGEGDAIISDALNHASIIDGIRLCKAERHRYANCDMNELENALKRTQNARTRLIATDGVFSMDGSIAPLRHICDLAERYNALVMVDDSHAVGFMGATGRGTPEHCGVADRIDFLTGTLGKALGGGSGGYTSGRRSAIAWLRQRSRPYLFSNSIPPVVAAVSVRVLDLVAESTELRSRLFENAAHFRAGLTQRGFKLLPGEHPIIPVMLGDAKLASGMADKLLEHGVYVIGFSFPVVPKGLARIRTQMSAALSREQLDRAIAAFGSVGRELGVIS
jgi:glycine C-acetyltransferase